MTHKAKSLDGLDATKINKSDGGAGVTLQRDGWFDAATEGVCVRTVQKMQNEAGLQLGMLSILKVRGKSCMKLPGGSYSGHILNLICVSCREHTEKDDPSVTCCLYHVLSNEPDFKSQKSWSSETVEKYPGCQLIFYPKFQCELNFIERHGRKRIIAPHARTNIMILKLVYRLRLMNSCLFLSRRRHLIIVHILCTVTEADSSVLSLNML